MSYRLIDSNAIADKYPEVNDMPCVFADLPNGLDGSFIDVQPVVRCKDCKLSEEDKVFGDTWCGGSIVDPEGYCHIGERKDNVEQSD